MCCRRTRRGLSARPAAGHPLLPSTSDELTARFVADLVSGDVRAGVPKAGVGYWSISAFEHRVLAAVGAAHRDTGAPVMVHLEHGSAAFEVLAELAGHGVPAERVALAHADRNPDPGLHAELCAAGVYLGYDGMARHREWPDSLILRCLLDTAARGGAQRLLLGAIPAVGRTGPRCCAAVARVLS